MARVILVLETKGDGVDVNVDYGGEFDPNEPLHQMVAFLTLEVIPELAGEGSEDQRVDAADPPRADVAEVDERND